MKRKIRIMLVEDHPEYREIIEFILKEETDIDLVSQFGNAGQALRSLQDMDQRKEVDLILLDLNLPGMSGIEALLYFKKALPDTRIIILTQSDNESDVLSAIQQGASGYLLKSCTKKEISQGIRNVYNGGATIDPSIARFILNSLQLNLPKAAVESEISPREMEILTLVGNGLSQKQISHQLKITAFTVADHLKHIYEKLHVANAPQAISKAYKTGLF
jgi:two-component system nitrate/nitrite response regulator NarL